MCLLGVLFAPIFVGVLHAGNDVLGEIQLLGDGRQIIPPERRQLEFPTGKNT
jgi:hypothetical protein